MAEVEYRQMQYTDDEATRGNIHQVAGYLTAQQPKLGLLMCGTCGNGKTTMLYAIRTASNVIRQQNESGATAVRIIDAKEVVEYAKDYKSFKSIKDDKCIAVEDMGREATEVVNYGNITNPIIDLLEYRYDRQLPTLITTNLTPKEVREKYGNRIADRFNEMFNVIVFGNKSYRK